MKPDLIDRIYECSFAPELWSVVLTDIAALAGARGGLLFMGNAQSGVLNWTASDGIREHMSEYVQGGWIYQGNRFTNVARGGAYGFVGEADLYSEDALASDPTYRDFLRPRGLGWAAGTTISLPSGDVLVFSFEREYQHGPVERERIVALDTLRPHLARSALMSARLRLERARALGQALELVGLPAVVLDSQRNILAVNALAEGLADYVHWRAGNTFALKDTSADTILRQACEALSGKSESTVRSFAVRGSDPSAAFMAHVIPVQGYLADLAGVSTGILVLTPVTMPSAAPVELIQSLFDLTASEARVARALVSGNSIDDIVASTKTSRNTIRTHVRRVLEKTGCTRQAEVVALLSGVKSFDGAR